MRLRVREKESQRVHEHVSLCLEGDRKTETQEYGKLFQTNRISVEVTGFVITKTLSLHPAYIHSKRRIWISK